MSEAFPGKYVKVMADYCAGPIWTKEGWIAVLDELPVNSALQYQLLTWARFYDDFCQDYLPPEEQSLPPFPVKAFSEIGAFLAKQVKQQLGDDWTVEYYAEDTRKTYLIEQPSNSGGP